MASRNMDALIVDLRKSNYEMVNQAHLLSISVSDLASQMADHVEGDYTATMFSIVYMAEMVETLLELASSRMEIESRPKTGRLEGSGHV